MTPPSPPMTRPWPGPARRRRRRRDQPLGRRPAGQPPPGLAAGRDAYNLARLRYEGGLSTYLAVLTAEDASSASAAPSPSSGPRLHRRRRAWSGPWAAASRHLRRFRCSAGASHGRHHQPTPAGRRADGPAAEEAARSQPAVHPAGRRRLVAGLWLLRLLVLVGSRHVKTDNAYVGAAPPR